MPLIRADRVKESSTSTSTSAFLLNGADSTYRTFASVCAVGDTVYYAIAHRSANEWEVGLGTYSAVNTLTRTTVHASSNANAAVAFSTGTKDVLLALTKAQLETYATLAGTETLTNKTINASNNTITNVSLTTGVTGTLPIANGGTGTTTAQLAINALAGAVTSGSYLRGNGTNVVMATIAAGDVPTLNQNTTGTASGSVSGTASYLAKFTSTNVVGNSQIVDNGTSVGIGAVPVSGYTGYRLQVGNSTDVQTFIVIGNSTSGLGPTNGIVVGNDGSNAYLMNNENTRLRIGNNGSDHFVIDATGVVGVNQFTPAAQLHVTSAAAATKGVIVRGASAQSANLLELQNSSGTVLASVDPSGIAVFGAQTGAQNGYTIRAWSTPSNALNGQILTSLTGANGGGERYRMSIGNTSSYGFLQTYENSIGYTMSLALQPSGGSVGIGTTSPSDKLHVVGNVRAGSYTNGYLAMTGDLPGYSAGVYPTLKSDSTIFFSANGYYTAYLGDGSNRFALLNTSAQEKARLDPQGTSYFTGGAVAFGATTAAGGGQVYVAPQAAATKGLVVRGASGQSVNLQEWQNNSGTALAAVNSAGTLIPYAGIYTPVANGFVSELYITQQVSEYTQSFYRTLPSVVGDYVELIEVGDTNSVRYEFSISVVNYPYWTLKRYEFTTAWNNATNGVVPPVSISNRNYALDYDFELETVSVSSFYRRFRIKRTKGTTTNVQAMVLMRSFGDYATHNRTELTGTGTSAYSSYITRSYDYVNPNIAAPPPANYSGNGTPLSLYASSALTTGSGGGITLQSGNAATTGSGGSITLYTGAGAGTGVGGLIQSRSQADSYNRSSKFILVRSIPDTVGNYVELGRIGWLAGTVQKVSVYASRGAYDAALGAYNTLGKEYEFYSHYYSSGTVAPRTISGGNQGGRHPNEFELELAWNANGYQVLRLRRSKADATNFSGYTATVVIEQLIWSPHAMEFVELSGTGTSALTNAYLTNTGTYCYPALIPPPTGGTSGAGTDLAIYAGSAIGTGAGGNILLQAGAFATSGSNGKVIVRGLASNTANLQEWQNNAGTVLSAVNSAGSFTNTGGYSYSEEFGNAATVTNQYATAIGYGTTAGQLSTAVGSFAVTSGVTSTAIGADANADGGSTAVGRQATASGGSATAIGVNANAVGNNSIAIGRLAASNGGIAIGYNFTGAGLGYTSFCASLNGTSTTGAIAVYAGDGANNGNFSRQHSMLGTWATATYASRLGRVQLQVNDFTADREAIRYESNGTSALTSIGGAAVIASTTLAVQPAVSGNKGIVVKGASGQSANLQEWQNNAGAAGSWISSSGSELNTLGINLTSYTASYIKFDTSGNGLYRNNSWMGVGAGTFASGFFIEASNYGRPNMRSEYPDGAGSAGNIITTTVNYADATAKLLSVRNNGTEKFAVFSDGSMSGVDARLTGSVKIVSSSPAAFTADQNDLALTASGFQRLSGTAARNITGIAPPSGSHVDGRMIRIYNVGSFNLTLKHNSTSSTAANRFWNVQAIDIIVGANDYAELIYDGTNNGSGAAGWRVA